MTFSKDLCFPRKFLLVGSFLLFGLLPVGSGGVSISHAAEGEDHAVTIRLWTLQAERGHAWAQTNLGTMYERGKWVPQNYKEAIKWNLRAAKQGNGWAQVNLGRMYRLGRGVPVDYKMAIKWFRLSAVQELPWAQFNLGRMYRKGQGVEKDYVQAYKWFDLAKINLLEKGAVLRDELAQKMSPEEIANAKAAVKQCLDSKYKDCD